jgi:hypothetical protein
MSDMERKGIESILSQDAFILINKKLFKVLGGDCPTAVLLGELISISKYFYETKKIDWFFITVDSIERALLISDSVQRRSLSFLKEIGFIELEKRGIPQKRFIKINYSAIMKAILEEQEPIRKKKDEKSSVKKEFYDRVNDAMKLPYDEANTYFDNIPTNINQVMYAWSYLYDHFVGEVFIWNSASYGKLSYYIKQTYGKYRTLDFYNLLYFFESIDHNKEKGTINNFINFDSTNSDRFPGKHVDFSNFIYIIKGELDGKKQYK